MRRFKLTFHKVGALSLCSLLLLLGLLFKSSGISSRHNLDPPPPRMRRELTSIVDMTNSSGSSSSSNSSSSLVEPGAPRGFVEIPKLNPKPSLALIESMRKNGPMGVLGTQGDIQQIIAKMKKMEDKRQEVYLRLLDRRGQKVALTKEGGGHALVSFPQALIRMPNTLKYKPIDEWSKYEGIWQNVTHFPWYLNDAQCKHYSISFALPHSLEPLGLVSYPSSGNTWLRYLVEGATGYFTGSMYNDLMLGTKGLYGEIVPWNSGMTVAIKSHGHTTGQGLEEPRDVQVNFNHFEEFDKRAILLIRNPFRAIIGHRHLDAGGHTGFADEDQFLGEDWDHFVRVKIASWENLYLDWLHEAEPEDIHVIHFETLKDDLVSSLRALVQFMELEVDEGRLKCTWRNNEGNFHRKKTEGSLAAKENPFTSEHTILIRDSIHRVNQALFEKKKPEMPLDQYELYQT